MLGTECPGSDLFLGYWSSFWAQVDMPGWIPSLAASISKHSCISDTFSGMKGKDLWDGMERGGWGGGGGGDIQGLSFMLLDSTLNRI